MGLGKYVFLKDIFRNTGAFTIIFFHMGTQLFFFIRKKYNNVQKIIYQEVQFVFIIMSYVS